MPFRVRFADTDKMGVVYHSNYLIYLHEARDDFFKQLYLSAEELERLDVIFPTHALDIVYNRSLYYGDNAIVVTELASLSPIRLIFHHKIFLADSIIDSDQPLAEAHVEVYSAKASNNKPMNLKMNMPELFQILQGAFVPKS